MAFDFVFLLLLGALLGSSFVLMKASVASLSVFMTVFLRLAIALAILLVAIKCQKMKLPPLMDLGFWLVCGVLGFSANILPFGLITSAEIYIETNLASL
ncbi:MAG: EamA family transporter [Candidatus Puniceispirillaceae bacterium]